MEYVKRPKPWYAEFRLWFKRQRVSMAMTLIIVIASGAFTWLLAPFIQYQTALSILTVLADLAGVLIAFTAVVAVQVLSSYRDQLNRSIEKQEIESRRKTALSSIRYTMVFFVAGILTSVVIMAQLIPGMAVTSIPFFFVIYFVLAGVIQLLDIFSEL
jgi:hypothetical protein